MVSEVGSVGTLFSQNCIFVPKAKFQPPEPFDFSQPAGWPEWRERFKRFRIATKLTAESGEIQVNSLVYAMGREGEKVFTSFTFPTHAEGDPDPRINYNTVLDKFNTYFVPKRNIIHERGKFYARSQVQGESVEQCLRCLYDLIENCNFDNEEEALRDRLVLGFLDSEVSHKLQLEDKLTLQAAVDTARYHELVKAQLRDQKTKNKTLSQCTESTGPLLCCPLCPCREGQRERRNRKRRGHESHTRKLREVLQEAWT